MSVIPNGYAECAAHFRQTGDPDDYLVVTGHDLGVGPNDPNDVANAVFDTWSGGQWSGTAADSVSLVSVSSRVNRGAGIEVGNSNRVPVVGVIPSPMMTPNVTWLMRKSTALGGRRGRGRMYLPGVVEANVDSNGNLLAAQIAANNTFGSDFLTTSGLNDVLLVVLHNTAAVPPTIVTGLTADTRVATQRRRLR